MKKALVIVIVVMLCALQAFAQKGSTMGDDYFTGLVVKTEEASREITLQYGGQDKSETFVGALKEGYQAKRKDGTVREVKLSELTQGIRIRVYYKKISQEVHGQRVKTNLITRIEFLGRDEYAVMRQYLKVEPSTPVTFAESKILPDADPLRLKIAADNSGIIDAILKWVEGWNKREAKKYGQVSIVSAYEQADVTLVIHTGSDAAISTIFPMMSGFLVVEKPTGLEVIWKDDKLTLPELFVEGNPEYKGRLPGMGVRIAREIEKRLIFRHKAKQKE